MAFSIERVPAQDLLIARGHGHGNVAEGMQVIEAIRAEWATAPTRHLLVDISDLDMVPTRQEAQRIAEAYTTLLRGRQCTLAFQARPGAQFGVTRMIEILAEIRGVTVSSFFEREEALEWLRAGPQPPAR